MLTFVNIIIIIFWLIALAPYVLAQRHSLTKENLVLGFTAMILNIQNVSTMSY